MLTKKVVQRTTRKAVIGLVLNKSFLRAACMDDDIENLLTEKRKRRTDSNIGTIRSID